MQEDVKRRAGPYEGDGKTKSFPFSFYVFSANDVKVVTSVKDSTVEETLEKDVDYSVTVNADQNATPGGTVVLTDVLASNHALSILSDLAYTQEMQLTNFSRFPPEILNSAMDRTVILIQQLKEQIDRTLTVPATSTQTPEQLLNAILETASTANEYAQAAKAVHEDVIKRNEEIVEIRDHVDEQAAKVDAAIGNIEKAAEDAVSEIGSEAEKKVDELGETTENLKSALGVTKNDLAAELTAHASNETRIATQEIDAAKETAIANADERITNRESIAVSNVNSVASASVESVNQARDAALGEVGIYVNAAQQQASSAQQSASSAIQAASNAQQAASNAQSSASASAQSAQSASYSASSADSSMRSASDYASQSSTSASSSASSASKAAQSAASAEESAKTASFSVRYGQSAYANSSIQAADLVPSVNVKVGDHVINVDGELFLIDSVKNGVVHVGEVIVTLKGKDGAGLTLNGEFGSYNDLVATRPVGQPGDAYLIQGNLWYWAEDDNAWKNAGPFRGPQGERGPQGFTFTPTMASDGTLSWSNNGGLENPISKNLTGPRGYHFAPSVNNNGDLSWTNDGDLDNPATKNIRGPQGFTFTPSVDGKGNISWINNGNLDNPETRNIRGYHYTPALDGKGNLSWTNNGELENPATKNIRGYHFTPSVDGKGNLSWTNNGDLDNPATQNIRGPQGFTFTPSVAANGDISWTNNGDLTNPSTVNIRGPQGFTFTPSVSDKGIISWTNNGGLSNPSSVDIKGPSFVTVSAQIANASAATWDDWEALLDSGELTLMPGDFTNLRVNDMIVWSGLFVGSESGELGFQNFIGFAVVTSIDKANYKIGITGGTLLFGMPGAQGKNGNNIIHYTPSQSFEYTYDRWKLLFRQPGSVTTFEADKNEVFGWHENDVLVVMGSISDRETASVVAFYRYNYWTDLEGNDGVGAGLINATLISGIITGVEGKQGERGAAGYVFTPSVNSSGDLSWSNNGNLANPATVNIKGPKGDQGEKGEKGDGLSYEDLTPEQIAEIKGPKGDQGIQGPEGPQGKAFTYDDFTNAQLEALRGPQGETGQSTKAVTIFFKSAKTFTLAELKAESGSTMSLGGVDEKTDYESLNVGDVIAIPGTISDQNDAPCVLYGHFQSLVFAGGVGITFKVIGGIYGVAGKDGSNGKDAVDGKDGVDGKTPQVSFRLDSSGNLYYTVTV